MACSDADFTLLQPTVTAVPGGRDEPGTSVALQLVGAHPGAGRLQFEVDMPTREHVRLVIYDVAGRRVRSLIDGQVPAGTMRVPWDGKDQAGTAVRTGLYFARLSGGFGSRVVRAAFVR